MKKFLLASVALFGIAGTALAADLPARRAPPPVFTPVPVFTWTGFYAGVNAGGGFSDHERDNFSFGSLTAPAAGGRVVDVVPATGGSFVDGFGNGGRRDRSGFVGGGQVGFNYQLTPGAGFVVGLEADIQYADFGRDRDSDNFGFSGFGVARVGGAAAGVGGVGITDVGRSNAPGFGGPGAQGNVAFFNNGFQNDVSRIEWFGTVRGRLGYAIDRFMIYGTGGIAFTDFGDRRGINGGFANGAAVDASGVPFFVGPGSRAAGIAVNPTGDFRRRGNDDIGYVAGGGIEYAFTNNISLKVEGLYVSFERDRDNGSTGVVGVTNTGAPITAADLRRNGANQTDFAVVRAGLNFRFGTY